MTIGKKVWVNSVTREELRGSDEPSQVFLLANPGGNASWFLRVIIQEEQKKKRKKTRQQWVFLMRHIDQELMYRWERWAKDLGCDTLGQIDPEWKIGLKTFWNR